MIYILRAGSTDCYKIGYTAHDSPQLRRKACQTGNHEPLHVVVCLEGTEDDEAALHRDLAAYQIPHAGTEWFRLTLQQVQELTQRGTAKSMHTRPIGGPSPADVRPLRRRQQYPAPDRGSDVPRQPSPFDDPRAQPVQPARSREHEIC